MFLRIRSGGGCWAWRRKGDVAALCSAGRLSPSCSGVEPAVLWPHLPLSWPLPPWLTPGWHTQHHLNTSSASPFPVWFILAPPHPPAQPTLHGRKLQSFSLPPLHGPAGSSARLGFLLLSSPPAPSVPGSLRTGGKAPWRSLPGPQWPVLPSQHLSVLLSPNPGQRGPP